MELTSLEMYRDARDNGCHGARIEEERSFN